MDVPETSPLGRLRAETDLALPRLLTARRDTVARLERRRALMREAALPDDLAVVFVGSWGRQEVTGGSDNDYYLLGTASDPTDAQKDAVLAALRVEDREFRGPGPEGTFGAAPVRLAQLTKHIGLDRDTNGNLTRRMLLVLESTAVHNAALHRTARQEVIATYLDAPIKGHQPPRLFLNDVVRYWRTMCVDFAGKMRERKGQGWGLRNVKLRTTRKMLFASGLLPLLRCADLGSEEIPAFLTAQFACPPTDRVAEAFLALERPDLGRRVFAAYEAYLDRLPAVRGELDDIRDRATADGSDVFQAMARVGDDIESGLRELLFETRLAPTAQRYGIF